MSAPNFPFLDYASSPIRRRLLHWRRVAVICIVATIILLIYRPFSPGARQAQNLAHARAQIPTILVKIAIDQRFDHVAIDDYTGASGSIIMFGEVRSQADLSSLKSIVTATVPPAHVLYHVAVCPENELLKRDAAGTSTSRPTTWP